MSSKPTKLNASKARVSDRNEAPNSNRISNKTLSTDPNAKRTATNAPTKQQSLNAVKPNTNAARKTIVGRTVDATKPKLVTTNKITTDDRVKKLVLLQPNKSTTKRFPIKAVYTPKALHPPPAQLSHNNVMNTVHNVTVLSPPSVRKETPVSEVATSLSVVERKRTLTRTLRPEEVLNQPTVLPPTNVPIKEPVSFEINFDETALTSQPTKAISIEINDTKHDSLENTTNGLVTPQDTSDDDYEDDFDSYESDFESYSQSSTASSSHSIETTSAKLTIPNEGAGGNRDLDLDSGLYDIKLHLADETNGRKTAEISIDDGENQIDSGFGYTTAQSPIPKPKPHQIIAPIRPVNRAYQRSIELMSKITLDTMSFALFELKPIAYEYYMKMFGRVNATQISTQTGDAGVEQDCQTDAKRQVSMWTQWPPQFGVNQMHGSRFFDERLGCGMENSDPPSFDQHEVKDEMDIDQSLDELRKLSSQSSMGHRHVAARKNIDFNQLNWFLRNASKTIASILGAPSEHSLLRSTDYRPTAQTDGYFVIDWQTDARLRTRTVLSILGNAGQTGVMYSVHGRDEETDCLVAVWRWPEVNTPMHVLSCWSRAVCVEGLATRQDVVFAGLVDGSIAVWNLLEYVGLQHQETEMALILIPCHVVEPVIQSRDVSSDFGPVVTIKAIDTKQICSLHEGGLLTTWSLLHITNYQATTEQPSSIDHTSPWSTLKLVQSNIVDLRAHHCSSLRASSVGRPTSAFDQTRSYFESNIFSDAALQELHKINTAGGGLFKSAACNPIQFQCLDLSIVKHTFYVATNQSFLLTGAKTLHAGTKVRTIPFTGDQFVHATRIEEMRSADAALLIGMSDGSVRIIWCKTDSDSVEAENHEHEPEELVAAGAVNADNWNFNAKSCAIQNIIMDERRVSQTLAEDLLLDGLDNNHCFTDKLRLWNQLSVLHGFSTGRLRADVRWVHHCVRHDRLVALCGRSLRQFWFDGMSERTAEGSTERIESAAVICTNDKSGEYLALLVDHEIRVYVDRKLN